MLRQRPAPPFRLAKLLHWVELSCWMLSLTVFARVASNYIRAEDERIETRAFVERMEVQSASQEVLVGGDAEPASLLGQMSIPDIDMSVPILEGSNSATLRYGIGHIPGTALPGGLGNVGVAGHRDTFLRKLQGIRPKMMVSLVTRTGTFSYQVDSVEVVEPDKVDVLDIGQVPQLTIITCYPFRFIGAAPKRFIVHAHLLPLTPLT